MEFTFSGSAPSVRGEEYVTVYSNVAKVQVTAWDLKFTFGQLSESVDGKTTNNELATIVMSPQHAKALLNHWLTAVKTYETTFGSVEDPTPKLEELARQAGQTRK